MRRFLTVLTLVIGVTQAAQAQDAAIQGVITGQLEAFEDRDVQAAWQFASPLIQGIFKDPVTFATMVQRGYPMVWDHRDIRFLELREGLGVLHQKVMLRDAQGVLHILDYKMIDTGNGWQIDGVQILPAPEAGA